MRKIDPKNENLTSRVIPGLRSEYQIVSLPFWAWFWLDDFMNQNRISYQGILEHMGCVGDVNRTFKQLAELHQDHCLRGEHKLANDNNFLQGRGVPNEFKDNVSKPLQSQMLNMPKIYKLFSFMPCATTLDAVWSRKNYDDQNKI